MNGREYFFDKGVCFLSLRLSLLPLQLLLVLLLRLSLPFVLLWLGLLAAADGDAAGSCLAPSEMPTLATATVAANAATAHAAAACGGKHFVLAF